jgi:hypothetical protein
LAAPTLSLRPKPSASAFDGSAHPSSRGSETSESAPLCDCHGEPKRWRPKEGVYSGCQIKNLEGGLRRSRKWRAENPEGYRRSNARNNAKSNPRRIRAGSLYCGAAKTIEEAALISERLTGKLTEFKSKQANDKKEAADGWKHTAVS